MWPVVDGLRALELGVTRRNRAHLNELVLAGPKQATAGSWAEYETEGEPIEHVGERLALLDDDGRKVGTVEVTGVERMRFDDVPYEFAQAEGEGFVSLAEWREVHRDAFEEMDGISVDGDTPVVCVWFRLVEGGVAG
jgi:uncharacterized protein YhfF